MTNTKRPSIAELEKIIERGDDATIEIMPDGSIRETGITPTKKPLTMGKDLGSDY